MKAAVLTKLNAPLEVWELEPTLRGHDTVCAPSQVLVDVRMSGICGSQLKEIGGEKGNEGFLPHCLGHEGVGTVRAVGPGVSVQMIGRKVVCHWRKGEGSEAHLPATYEAAGGQHVGGGHVTTLSEQAVVSRNRVTVVPDDVPDELCALLGCGLSTALGTIEHEARLKFGESILIVGCGGVGLNLIQAARLAQAYPIVAMDITDEKNRPCCILGAHKYVNGKKELAKDALHAFGLKGFDVIVDTSGSVQAIEAAVPLLSDRGRFVMIGQPKPKETLKIHNALDMFLGEGRKIIATQGGGFRPSEMISRYVNLWRGGMLNINDVISHYIPLAEINRGIDLVRAGQAGRVMVTMR